MLGSGNAGAAPVATAAAPGVHGGGGNGNLSKPAQGENSYESILAGGRRGSHDMSGATADNGQAGVGNGDAASDTGDGHENGEITVSGSKSRREEGEADVEAQRPPKEDVMVDFTDEFGRVRTMLQR